MEATLREIVAGKETERTRGKLVSSANIKEFVADIGHLDLLEFQEVY